MVSDDILMNQPLVSVCVQTYQQEPYLRRALDSILVQKTKFIFEILLGEDESTDGTREICIEYAQKYPNMIRLFLNKRSNVIYVHGRPTGRWNLMNNLKNARGKYIAFCDGDDYWTDPDKLQKQVTFLEKKPSYSLCFHNVFIHDTTGDYTGAKSYGELNKLLGDNDKTFTIADTARGGLIPTSSVLVRNTHVMQNLPPLFQRTLTADWLLWCLACGKNKLRYLALPMAVYRVHSGGVSYAIRRDLPLLYLDRAEVLMDLDLHFKKELHNELSASLIHYLLRLPFNDSTCHIFDRFRDNYPEMVFVMLEQLTKNALTHIRNNVSETNTSTNTIADYRFDIVQLLEWTKGLPTHPGLRHTDSKKLLESCHRLALCYSLLNYHEKAIEICQHCLKSCECRSSMEAAEVYHNMAKWHVKLKNYRKALNAFSNAIKYDPTKIEIYLNKSDICRYFKQYEESFRQLDLLENIDPMFPGLQETRSKIWKVLYEQT